MAVSAVRQALPFMAGGDEYHHYNYVQHLYQTGTLPDRTNAATSPFRQASGQAPLYYWVSSLALRIFNAPQTNGADLQDYLNTFAKNPWYTPPDLWNRQDNNNVYLYDGTVSLPDVEQASKITRIVSMLFGLVAVCAAHGVFTQLFGQSNWTSVGTAIFALTPMFVYLSSFTRNDTAATAFATLTLWQCLRILKGRHSAGQWFLLGLLLGLAGLAKVNTLTVGFAVAATIIFWWRNHHMTVPRAVINTMLVALPVLLTVGVWMLYGCVTYGDPFGTGTHYRPDQAYETALSLGAVVNLLPNVYVTYWAFLGSTTNMSPWAYLLLGLIVVMALLGYCRLFSSQHRPNSKLIQQQAILIIVFGAAAIVAMLQWLRTVHFVTGHVLYPAHIVIAIALTVGLSRLGAWFQGGRHLIQLIAVAVVAFSSIFAAPLALIESFSPPQLWAIDQLPGLQGGPFDFDGVIQLLGIHLDDNRLSQHGLYSVTLCWQVLQETDRPAAFSVRLTREGHDIGVRTSIHGMGHYPSSLWHIDDIFCDDVDIPLQQSLEPATLYSVQVNMLDAETGDFDWLASTLGGESVPYPFVAEVVASAGDMRSQMPDDTLGSDVNFPQLAILERYSVDGNLMPGEQVRLSLQWHVTAKNNANLKQFIHLYGDDYFISLADGIPHSNAYPTWAWQVGEYIVDQWDFIIPDNLLPGEYNIRIGFYDEQGRLSAQNGDSPSPDNAALLVSFEVTE
ncbi:MAG: glycosyltransferase family 39 protein [Anaerolineae bacterium]|nr:glycosyltransferase family 39 protein [Anaerolineae bacterium]